MPGGYLRILYPAPTECHNLQSWQEFYGFDMQGQEGMLDISVDTDKFTMTIRKQDRMPMFFARFRNEQNQIKSVEEIKKVKAIPTVSTDFYGNPVNGEERLPGPFAELSEDVVINIDPRKL